MDKTKKRFKLNSLISKTFFFYAVIILASILIFMRFDYQWKPNFGASTYKEQAMKLWELEQKEFTKKGLCVQGQRQCPIGLDITADVSLLIKENVYGRELKYE